MRTNPTYKYNWLIGQLKKNDGLTIKQIKSLYYRSDIYYESPLPFSERTFHHWRRDILSTYGIEIYCDKTNHQYLYKVRESNVPVAEWLSDTMAVQQTISNNLSIKDRILIEPVPNCAYLNDILEAIKKNLCITFTYTDYWDEPKVLTIKPLFIKMFRQRWHVIGPEYNKQFDKKPISRFDPKENDTIRAYGMDDRLTNLELTDITFNYPSEFNPAQFYATNFSTIKWPEKHMKVETVTMLVWAPQNFYLRSVPLHHTQKEVYTCEEEGYSIFQYTLQPTLDFEMELRSHGDHVEVLSPAWFRKEMKDEAQKVVNAYKGSDRKTLKKPLPPEFEP